MQQSNGYILNRRPYRENSLLIDLFTEQFGRTSCIAHPAKKRGKVVKGCLEPFRYLQLQWTGRGNLKTLIQADELGRHTIPSSELIFGIYLNELLMRLTEPEFPLKRLFSAYKITLHHLSDQTMNRQIVMRFELFLLETLGYRIAPESTADTLKFAPDCVLLFSPEQGIHARVKGIDDSFEEDRCDHRSAVPISADLLAALQDLSSLDASHWAGLRQFLDRTYRLLSARPIHSRKMLDFNSLGA